ncbi:hypothetical protein MPTK1_4g10940 [Marchantia polymorpha subsp. ruderalis]|nr:hypothetical protein MARPO_0011s0079 [Marchantia polymorpha]BBN08361.1 hypothetical protein Mp_4g10940 [Marchantia polymorpha subsp. ruderalis]|eukprot:PTQ46396.1 hypothetical protein MARPO_0011s0079 [Marchantia polymorpha]
MEAEAVIVLLLVFGGAFLQTLADTGFISIDCGASSAHVDPRNITWVPDSGFVATGYTAKLNTTATSPDFTLDTLRYFPASHKMSCYVLQVQKGSRYLVRTSYRYGNYDGQDSPPEFNLAIDATIVSFIKTSKDSFEVHETIATAQDEVLSVCLFSESVSQRPFISALELRRIGESMYTAEDGQYLNRISRINFGAKSDESVRYPDDPYDRVWDSDMKLFEGALRETIATSEKVEQEHLREDPPSAVLETALTSSTTIIVPVPDIRDYYRAYLYFAEVINLDEEVLRSFDIILNGVYIKRDLSISAGLHSGLEIAAGNISGSEVINVTLSRRPYSNLGPIINALEIYSVIPGSVGTFESDVLAVRSLVSGFKLEQLSVGDPCVPIAWEWLSCTTENPPRVSAVLLSRMNLTGFIPSSVLDLPELTDLWLDHNQLEGSIPDLSSLRKLRILHLEDNELDGSLPVTLGKLNYLGEIILDNNHFSGQVPLSLFTKSNLKISLAGNPEMSLPGCVTGSGSCTQSQSLNASSQSRKRKTPVVIISVVAGVAATFFLIVIGTFGFFLSKKKNKFPESPRKNFYTISDLQATADREEVVPTSLRSVGRTRTRSRTNEELEMAAEAREFTSSEIRKATRNFMRKVGEGTFGPVFYGKLSGGKEIAVRIHGCYRTQDFQDGVDVLARVRHQNLVSMIGYSQDSEDSLLIYEFLPGGSLMNNLNDPEASKLLTWNARLNIALQAAKGLLHLHTDYNPPIIHRNMKSSNILLTKKFSAKVADFGLSNLAPEGETNYVSILVKGATSGYLDPEFYSKQKFTEKSDVYSFGVVLLEIISGRRPVNLQLSRAEWNLSDWVRHQLELGNVEAIVDPALNKAYNIASMWKVADIAMYSVEPEAKHRPAMSEVVKELEDALFLEAQGRQSAGPLCTTFSLTDKAERSHLEPVYKKLLNREDKL